MTSDPNPVNEERPQNVPVGVVGLGLMGTSIIACLLAAGHPVVGVTRNIERRRNSPDRIRGLLAEMRSEGLITRDPDEIAARFQVTDDYADLADCRYIFESILEDLALKKETIAKIEAAVSPTAVIGSNTSSIPVTTLQKDTAHPERVLGIHWGEPAHVNRFLEIICGSQSDGAYAARVAALARFWGKEPTLVKKDVRGFITNRIMYAMLREAFYLVENGYATPADVDRSLRNDYGYWMTFAGPFRFMDLTGISAYQVVMEGLLPELDCSTKVPELMRQVVESGAEGIRNARGFYTYTPEQAENWERLFLKFSYEIRALAAKYPENVGDLLP
jgi:3-hydroxybutyryl-CoA dehydrogenase